ncbi:MAG TPA: 4-(cytidine 5'-diphospho)-2-C-methyl-D-erythritol kinase [Terracidiphilus sp.]|nr:4-(cytidine 5'-diphospho)-2-C-methyl-D-erythritol kinase [Terracidiphilus sp.]
MGLYIGAPRADGFHGLATVYQTLEMHDVVRVEAQRAAETRITLRCNDARVPTDERNTVWRMISLALEALGVRAEVSIDIDKRLPVQGGMGAGSANAAAALVGLENELDFLALDSSRDLLFRVVPSGVSADRAQKLELETPRAGEKDSRELRALQLLMAELKWAGQVGSDVPLFLVGGAVLGTDRGQTVYPLKDFEPVWCVAALPEVGVSTPEAFKEWDKLCAEQGLTEAASAGTLKELSRAYASAFGGVKPGEIPGEALKGRERAGSSGVLSVGKDLAGPQESALVRTGILSWIRNDFERVVFRQHSSLAEIKQILAAADTPGAALHASLSGSGSALFGLYKSREDAEAALERLKAAGVRGELTRTLPRREYWAQMLSANEG